MAKTFDGVTNQVAKPAYTSKINLSVQAKFVLPDKGSYGQVYDQKKSKIKLILTQFKDTHDGKSIIVSYNLDVADFWDLLNQVRKVNAFSAEYQLICNIAARMQCYNPNLALVHGFHGQKIIGFAPETTGQFKGLCKASSCKIWCETARNNNTLMTWGVNIRNGYAAAQNNRSGNGTFHQSGKMTGVKELTGYIQMKDFLNQMESVERYYNQWRVLPENLAAFNDGYHAYLEVTNQRDSRHETRGEEFAQEYEPIPSMDEPAPTPTPSVAQQPAMVANANWPPKSKAVDVTFEGSFQSLENGEAVITGLVHSDTTQMRIPIFFNRIPSEVQDAVNNGTSIRMVVYSHNRQVRFFDVA